MGREGVVWIHLEKGKVQWQAVLITVSFVSTKSYESPDQLRDYQILKKNWTLLSDLVGERKPTLWKNLISAPAKIWGNCVKNRRADKSMIVLITINFLHKLCGIRNFLNKWAIITF
jgi:hypothetical protein